MKLSEVKKRLGTVSPFVTYDFRGREDMLVVDEMPLTVELTPPSMAFILESGQITSLILRYSSTYQEQLEKTSQDLGDVDANPLKGRPEIAQEIMKEMRDKIGKSDDEQARMIGVIVKLGREYLIQKATYAYYGKIKDKSEKFEVIFTDDQESAKEWNDKNPEDDSKLVIWVDSLDDAELVNVGIRLMDALPKVSQSPANIPFLGDVVNPSNAEIEKGVVASVPANEVATFPRNIRNIAVEDVSESGGGKVGDVGGDK